MRNLVFKPTKVWLDEHKGRPQECHNPDCICVIDNINKHHHGFCCGFYPHNGDLDMVMLCTAAKGFLIEVVKMPHSIP